MGQIECPSFVMRPDDQDEAQQWSIYLETQKEAL